MSEIKEFFRNQTVFVTGGSGFLGKLYIEKLLRECEIQKIYIMMRAKKNKSPDERFHELFDYACFDVVKAQNPDLLQKACLITGDCQKPNLGLNQSDVKILLEETTCVIHAAANVKFNQTLREATSNVTATRDVLELAKQMKKLRVFVHVSTAYSNCIHRDVREEFYEPPLKLEDLVCLTNSVDDDTLKVIAPHVLGKWPNTYVYTKCVSEELVKRAAQELPVVVVRPAIVTGTASEPVLGWIDNFNGVGGILSGAALGVVRTFNATRDTITRLVPADYVVNCTLAAAWYREQSGTTDIYNYVGHRDNLIHFGRFMKELFVIYPKTVTTTAVWYNTFTLRGNKTWNKICVFFLHTLVAYFVDFVLWCLRKPTLAVKAYERIDTQSEVITYFTTRNWNFESGNVDKLWKRMNLEDKKAFFFDMENLDWKQYLYDICVGGRMYLLKETMETLPKAQRKMKTLMVAHYAFLAVFWWLVYKVVRLLLGFLF